MLFSLIVALIVADAVLLALLLWRRERLVLCLYLAFVIPLYLVREQLLHLPRGPIQPWFWAAMHVAVALETCLFEIRPRVRSAWMLVASGVAAGAAFACLVLAGGVGVVWVKDKRFAYYLMTSTYAFCIGLGLIAATKRRAVAPLFLAAYFAVDVAVNAAWSWAPWRVQTATLTAIDHAGHALIVLLAIWSLRPRSVAVHS